MLLLAAIIAMSYVVFLSASIVYCCTGVFKKFYHDILGWHQPINKQGAIGCIFTSKCKHCGKDIMQDSQGNWF